MKRPTDLYFGADARRFSSLYESTTFEKVHSYLLDVMPAPPARVLDIGAGSGRDAAALAALGYTVTAAEPSPAMLRQALVNHPTATVRWIEDALPDLAQLSTERFDLVLLSAVWMFIDANVRSRAIIRIAELCDTGGVVALSARETRSGEPGHFGSADLHSTVLEFQDTGFRLHAKRGQPDSLGRPNKEWTTLIFIKSSL